MDDDVLFQYLTIASVAFVAVTSINGLVYWVILDVKYTDRINLLCQLFGLIATCIFQAGRLLVTFGYLNGAPILEFIINTLPWQIYFNCYFIVFIRQSDPLIPRKMAYGAWIYLVFLNAIAILDTYAYYLEYCVSEKWTWLGVLIDLLSLIFILILECIINIWIIVKIAKKVRSQANLGYKTFVTRLSVVLVLFFMIDIVNIACNLSGYQSYECILWGVSFALKIQVEGVCLGKIRECIVIMENYENA
jgi:hypothetical protein